jgi:hypothetical protein
MTILSETFAERLSALRVRQNLTAHQLAVAADVPPSLISGLQTGNRCVGEDNARKIGVALGLMDKDLEEFVFMAINQSTERVLMEFKEFPAEVLNLVAVGLRNVGIYPDEVGRCIFYPRTDQRGTTDAGLYLRDGRSVLIQLKIVHK